MGSTVSPNTRDLFATVDAMDAATIAPLHAENFLHDEDDENKL